MYVRKLQHISGINISLNYKTGTDLLNIANMVEHLEAEFVQVQNAICMTFNDFVYIDHLYDR